MSECIADKNDRKEPEFIFISYNLKFRPILFDGCFYISNKYHVDDDE